MTSQRRSLLTVAALVVVVASVAVGSSAAAFWRVTGAGSGAGGTANTVPVTLSTPAVSGALYPGGSATVTTTASNIATNSATVKIVSIVLDTAQGTSGFTVDAAHAAGCPASSFTFTTQNNGGAGWTVGAASSLAITMTNALSMATTAASACQGATVTVFLKAAGS